MKIINYGALHDYCTKKGGDDAKTSIITWKTMVEKENWKSPMDIKSHWPKARILAGNRALFNICGNKYRLVVQVNYEAKLVVIRFLGTHAEYDRIDAVTV